MPDEFIVNRERSNFVNVFSREIPTEPIKKVSRFSAISRPKTYKIVSKAIVPSKETLTTLNENSRIINPPQEHPELDRKMFHDYASNFSSNTFAATLNSELKDDLFGNIKARDSNALLDDIYTEKYHDLLKNNICQMIQGGRAIKLADPLKNVISSKIESDIEVLSPKAILPKIENNVDVKKSSNLMSHHQFNPLSPKYSPNSVISDSKNSFYSPKPAVSKVHIKNVINFDSSKMEKGKKDLHSLSSKTRNSVLTSLISP